MSHCVSSWCVASVVVLGSFGTVSPVVTSLAWDAALVCGSTGAFFLVAASLVSLTTEASVSLLKVFFSVPAYVAGGASSWFVSFLHSYLTCPFFSHRKYLGRLPSPFTILSTPCAVACTSTSNTSLFQYVEGYLDDIQFSSLPLNSVSTIHPTLISGAIF